MSSDNHSKKVVVTGITGLIGQEVGHYLKEMQFDTFGVSSTVCDIFDYEAVELFFEKVRPSHLLHLAWVTGGDYLVNPINEKYREASINLLKVFKKYGGKRAVFAGTCFEYEFGDEIIDEHTAINPTTLYASKKVQTYQEALLFSQANDVSFAWGRIFYVYGNNEKEGRLTSSIINSLKDGKRVSIKYGQLMKDYMYSKDIANAFSMLLDSDYEGAINICSGKGVTLADYASMIAKIMEKADLLDICYEETNQPLQIVGNNKLLREKIGFVPQYSIEEGLEEVICYVNYKGN